MEPSEKFNGGVLHELLGLWRSALDPTIHNAEADCQKLNESREKIAKAVVNWRAHQNEIQLRLLDLQQQVALAERQLINGQMNNYAEELERSKEELLQFQAREKEMRDDIRDLEECVDAIEEQLLSIKTQKLTLESPDGDESFLKNELSLFLNVSSILPDLGEPKFSGTFVDKQKGVKTFKFSTESMSQFEIVQAAWEMMR